MDFSERLRTYIYVLILKHEQPRTYIRHYYSEFLTLLVVGLMSLRSLGCALYILKCLNITFRVICSLGHTKIRRIALVNFLLTMAYIPDARSEKRFPAEEVIAAIFADEDSENDDFEESESESVEESEIGKSSDNQGTCYTMSY